MRNIETDFHMKRWLNRSCVDRFLGTRKETLQFMSGVKVNAAPAKCSKKGRKQIDDFRVTFKFLSNTTILQRFKMEVCRLYQSLHKPIFV